MREAIATVALSECLVQKIIGLQLELMLIGGANNLVNGTNWKSITRKGFGNRSEGKVHGIT